MIVRRILRSRCRSGPRSTRSTTRCRPRCSTRCCSPRGRLVERATAWFLRKPKLDIAARDARPTARASPRSPSDRLDHARARTAPPWPSARRALAAARRAGGRWRSAGGAARLPGLGGRYRAARAGDAGRTWSNSAGASSPSARASGSMRCGSPRASSRRDPPGRSARSPPSSRTSTRIRPSSPPRRLPRADDFDAWIERHARDLARLEALVREIEAAPEPDLAMLTVATRTLRGFLAS